MGEKDFDPLFKLPRLPAKAVLDLAEELSQFELPMKTLNAELFDKFHSQYSEIHHWGGITSAASHWSHLYYHKLCQI